MIKLSAQYADAEDANPAAVGKLLWETTVKYFFVIVGLKID